ncbi:MAG: protein kinase [Planctomycetota bacterium]
MTEGNSSKFGYQPGDRVVPGYRLVKMLGGGNFGEVWEAVGPGRVKAAIKILDLSELAGKLERGALDRIRDIRQPNLVYIFGIWTINRDGGVVDDVTSTAVLSPADMATAVYDPRAIDSAMRLVIAMQLGDMSLWDRLQRCQAEGMKGIPCKELLGYMGDAARGIDYLNEAIHDLGKGPVSIVHGDIKPQNLLLVGGGVQVCDYSLVRAVEDVQKTAMGGNCTPAYAAPELHVNKPCKTSDQYCLAMSYVELRKGNLPFPPDTKLTDLFYVKYERRLDFSGLDPLVVDVIRRATDPDPAARFASCLDMVEAIRQAEELRESKPRWFPPRIKISGKAWRKLLVGFLIIAVVATAMVWYLFRPVPLTKIDEWIKSDEFERAFAYTISRREAKEDTDNRFKIVLDQWGVRVELLGQQHDFKKAIDILDSISPTISDKDRDAKAQIDRTRLHAWEQLAEECIRPKSLDAEQIATVLNAKHIPDDKRMATRSKLGTEVTQYYEKSLADSDFDIADKILKRVAEIAKNNREVYAGLNFDLASQRAKRYERAFDYYKKAKKFRLAKALLADPDKTWPKREQNAQKFADAWDADLKQRCSNEEAFRTDDKIAEDVDAFLEFAPQHSGSPEVRIIRARVRIRNQSYTVVEELEKLEKTDSPEQSLLLLQFQLICKDRETPGDPIKLTEGESLLSRIDQKLASLGIDRSQQETKLLFSWEKKLYEESKTSVQQRRQQQIEDEIARKTKMEPPGTPPPPLPDPTETPQGRLTDAIAAFGRGDLERAKQKLSEAEKLVLGSPESERDLWNHKVDFWNSMVVFATSKPVDSHLPKLRDALKKVLDKPWDPKTLQANQVPFICKEVAVIAQCKDKAILDGSLILLRNILGSFGIKEKEIIPVLEALFQKRIHLVLQEEAPSGASSREVREQFEKLDGIWKEIKSRMVGENLAECTAWNIEYGIAIPAGEEELANVLRDGMALPAKSGAYVSYVRCLAFHENHKKTQKLLPNEWIAFLNDLGDVLAPTNAQSLTPERMQHARQWAADAVRELCKPTRASVDGDIWRVDFPTSNAAQIHALLKQLNANGSKFTEDLQTAWAFAGLYQSPCDFQPAEKLLAAIDFKSDLPAEQKLARESIPLLSTYLNRRLAGISLNQASPAEKTTVLRHAATFLRLFPQLRVGVISEAEAKRIAGKILDPAVNLADKIGVEEKGNQSLQAQRADLYEAVYDFTDVFSKIPWQDKSQDFADPKKRSLRRAAILDSAIEAARQEPVTKTLARLLLKRASLRTISSNRNLEGAIRDAQEAIQYDPSLTVAHYVVRAKAHLMKTRIAASDTIKLAEVTESIQNCAAARKVLKPEDIGSKIDILLVRSAALVDRANCVRDLTFQKQRDDLHQAIADAQEAAKEMKKLQQPATADRRRAEEPDLALGNAHEDLAWIGDENAPENYALAIKAFQDAREKEGLGGRAEVSIGRCYYRIGMQSGFEAKDFNSDAMRALGIDSDQKARDMAETVLSGADPFDLGDAAQAEYYLADLLNSKSNYDLADLHFGHLVNCAGEDEAAKSFYRYLHARCYLSRWGGYRKPEEAGKADKVLESAKALVRQIDACKASLVDDGFDSRKQGVWLKAEMKRIEGKLEDAQKDLDDELSSRSPNFTPGHAPLLRERSLLSQQQGAKAYKDKNTQLSIESYKAALDSFEKEVDCVRMREDLVAAHLSAAYSAVIAYRISFWDPSRGPGVAERDFYAKAIRHLREVDRLWKHRPRKQYESYYHEVGLMFADKLSGIKSGRLLRDKLSADDANSAIRWAEYLAALNPGDQDLATKVEAQKRILSEFLSPPP